MAFFLHGQFLSMRTKKTPLYGSLTTCLLRICLQCSRKLAVSAIVTLLTSSAREVIVGWYSSSPKLRSNDLAINEMFKLFTRHPVFVSIDVQPKDDESPPTSDRPDDMQISPRQRTSPQRFSMTCRTTSCSLTNQDGTPTETAFVHLPCEIGALEAEEVGIEHLLRDVKDTTVSTLAHQVLTV